MAPKTATKRGRPCKDAPRAKVGKIDKAPQVDPMFGGIFDAVNRAVLPEQCKQMLMAIVPDSLGVAANERHFSQEAVVGIFDRMLADIKTKMTEEIEEQKGLITIIDTKKESLAGSAGEVESRKTAATALTLEKMQLVLAADRAVQEKMSLLEVAQSKQAEGDQALAPAQSEKDQFEAAADAEFKFLLESEERQEEEVKKNFDLVKPLIDKLDLDESLTISMFTACGKAPSARGLFDIMVVGQLRQHLKDKLAKLEEELAGGAPAKAERAEVVQAAQRDVDHAQEAQAAAKSESSTAHDNLQAVTAELRIAQEAVSACDVEREKASQALDAKVAVLQRFEEWNMGSFTSLKSKDTVAKDAVMEEDAEKADVPPVEQGGA